MELVCSVINLNPKTMGFCSEEEAYCCHDVFSLLLLLLLSIFYVSGCFFSGVTWDFLLGLGLETLRIVKVDCLQASCPSCCLLHWRVILISWYLSVLNVDYVIVFILLTSLSFQVLNSQTLVNNFYSFIAIKLEISLLSGIFINK